MTKARDLSVVPNQSLAFKNRIINGDCRIDQRNNGAAVNPPNNANTYFVDRFKMYKDSGSTLSVQQTSTAPNGFTNSLRITVSTGSSPTSAQEQFLTQAIEGFNIADLGWGTANAQTVTVSFWVRSSLTGTFSGAIQSSGAGSTYVFNYTISAANTWEQKSITIVGPTSGTWLTTNGVGLFLIFDIGSGSTFETTAGSWTTGNRYRTSGSVQVAATTGATWFVTGVQLEVGSNATSFDYRPYGTELALCQRYYWQVTRNTGAAFQDMFVGAAADQTTWIRYCIVMPVTMRGTPSLVSSAASSYGNLTATGTQAGTSISLDTSSASNVTLNLNSGGISTGQAATLRSNNSTTATIGFSAEL